METVIELELESVVTRVRSEFIEMPGLRVSVAEATRLWGLSPDDCRRVIDRLVAAAFLQRTRRGDVVRAA